MLHCGRACIDKDIKQSPTCCLLLKTCARCFPTSAERFRQTHQGLSMTLAAASKEAGHVKAVTMPEHEEDRG